MKVNYLKKYMRKIMFYVYIPRRESLDSDYVCL